MKQVARVIKMQLAPPKAEIFSEYATNVEIEDESGGEFVVVTQQHDQIKPGQISINPEEWPQLRALINRMIRGV